MNEDEQALQRLVSAYERPRFLMWMFLFTGVFFLGKAFVTEASSRELAFGLLSLIAGCEMWQAKHVLLPMVRQLSRLSGQHPSVEANADPA